MRAVQAKLVPD